MFYVGTESLDGQPLKTKTPAKPAKPPPCRG
jgi:hypothetical protein